MIFKLCWEDDRGPGYVETYDTSKTAFVYCDSGHDSSHIKNLYRIARKDSEQQ